MDNEMDSSLLLNISAGDAPTSKQKRTFGNDKKTRMRQRQKLKIKEFVTGNRESRQELGTYKPRPGEKPARKPAVPPAQTGGDDYDEEDITPVKKSRNTSTILSSKPPKNSANKQSKPQQIISSIFNKNPDIPRVASVKVKQSEEVVFSKNKFSQLPLHPHLISCLDKMCLTEMTEVQRRAIPHLLEGRDALIKSQTGSGKTLSYAVPLIQSLRSKPERVRRSDGVFAVILVPTRELALQSLAVLKKLVQSCIWIVPGLVIGGESRKSEKARLRKGVNILVATPGRLVDHCTSTNSLSFSRLEHLIIDEADRLLDMGFEKDVSQILTCIRQQSGGYNQSADDSAYQTVLLSATLSTDVKRLASVALTEPVTVDISVNAEGSQQSTTDGDEEGTFTLPSSLRQYYVITPSKLRLVTLTSFILDKCKHSSKRNKVIVFLPAQEVVQFFYELFQGAVNSERKEDSSSDVSDDEGEESKTDKRLFDVFALHGDMEQKYRSEVYTSFSKALSGVLLCTDVAARGLDIRSVDWIVQLSPPASTEDYVHRVGRTARIGVDGSALLFLLPSEVKYLDILNTAKISLKPLEVNSILKACSAESSSLPKRAGSRRAPNTIQETATALQQSLEEWAYNEPERLAQAKSAYQSFVRSYATYPSKLKSIFHIKYLHLGHLAKSFCLREAPGGLKGSATSRKLEKRSKAMKKAAQAHSNRKRKHDKMSEFASG